MGPFVGENRVTMAYGMQPQSDPTAVMGRRIAAYVLDGLLTLGVLVAVLALTKHQFFQNAPHHACQTLRDSRGFNGQCMQFGSHLYAWNGHGITTARLVSIVAGFLDLVVLQGIAGASVGKLIVGLRVVDAHGETCGFGRAFVRWIFLLVDGFCFLVGLIVALATHPHRRVGDLVAGTYVVGLASVGRPIVNTPAPPPYAYAQPGAPGWTPPGTPPAAPGWGATPPAGPGWNAPSADTPPPPPPPPAPAAWGTPPPEAPRPPTWGNADPAASALRQPGRTFGLGDAAVGLEVGARAATSRARTSGRDPRRLPPSPPRALGHDRPRAGSLGLGHPGRADAHAPAADGTAAPAADRTAAAPSRRRDSAVADRGRVVVEQGLR